MKQSILTIILSLLLSGVAASMISMWNYNRLETRKAKIETLKKITGNMWCIVGKQPSETALYNYHVGLNEAYITFNDSKEVITALKDLKTKIELDRIITLIKKMCKDLEIETSEINDSFITTVFTPTGTAQ